MLEFSVQHPVPPTAVLSDEMRLFLTEDGYQAALPASSAGKSKSSWYARVVEGHILDF